MAEATPKRLQQAAKDLNVGMDRVVEALAKKGIQVENKATTKLTVEQVGLLEKEFASSAHDRQEAQKVIQATRERELAAAPKPAAPAPRPFAPVRPAAVAAPVAPAPVAAPVAVTAPAAAPAAVVSAPAIAAPVAPAPAATPVAVVPPTAPEAPAAAPAAPGLKVLGKIDLDSKGRVVRPKAAAAAPAPAAASAAAAPKAPAAATSEAAAPVEAAAPAAAPVSVAAAPAAAPAPAAPVSAPATVAPAAVAPTAAPAATTAAPDAPAAEAAETGTITAKADQLKGLTVLGKIDLSANNDRRGPGGRGPRPVASSDVSKRGLPAGPGQKKRTRLPGPPGSTTPGTGGGYQGTRPGGGPGTGYQGNRPGGPGANRPGGPGSRPGGPGQNQNRPPSTVPLTPEDRKSTRLNSSHPSISRMPSSA